MVTAKAATLPLILASFVMAGEPSQIRLSQAHVQMPNLTVYLDILGANGLPVDGVRVDQFAAGIGTQSAELRSIEPFANSLEGIAYVFLVDVSLSLNSQQFVQVREALNAWVGRMFPEDRAAIISFGNEVKLVDDFTNDKTRLQNAIARLAPADQNTCLHEGLITAIQKCRNPNASVFPTRRVIVVLSDGKEECTGGATVKEVSEQSSENRIPIYAIGFGANTVSLDQLGTFARESGGKYLSAKTNQLERAYADVQQEIRRVFVMKLRCDKCPANHTSATLWVHLVANNMRDKLNISLTPLPPPPPPSSVKTDRPIPSWAYFAAGAVLLSLIAAFVVVLRRRKVELISEPPTEISPVTSPDYGSQPPTDDGRPKIKPAGLPLRLTVIGDDKTQTYKVELAERAVIGRSKESCDVVLSHDDEVSKKHCELILEKGRVFVQDLKSINGTLVNGVPITARRLLEDGDIILIGRTELRLSLPPGQIKKR